MTDKQAIDTLLSAERDICGRIHPLQGGCDGRVYRQDGLTE